LRAARWRCVCFFGLVPVVPPPLPPPFGFAATPPPPPLAAHCRHFVLSALTRKYKVRLFLLTGGWRDCYRNFGPLAAPHLKPFCHLCAVSPRHVATTRPLTHPPAPRVGGGGGSTPRPSATLASPAAPPVPHSAPPPHYYYYITVQCNNYFRLTESSSFSGC